MQKAAGHEETEPDEGGPEGEAEVKNREGGRNGNNSTTRLPP